MSEFTWYSRLAIWVGATVMLIQSITGRSVGVLMLLAVTLLGVGLALFLGGLVNDTLQTRDRSEPPRGTVEDQTAVSHSAPSSAESEVNLAGEGAASAALGSIDAGVSEIGDADTASDDRLKPSIARAEVPRRRSRVVTRDLRDGDAAIGSPCCRCEVALEVDDVIATCPICTAQHHAGCWAGNHFRCSSAGCAGRGSLDAPDSGTE